MTDTTYDIGEEVYESVHTTTLMSPRQLVTAVEGLAQVRKKLGLKASRSSVGEWRRDLGFRHGPFQMTHAIALAYYGDHLGLEVPKARARKMTEDLIDALAEQETQINE